MKKLKFILLTLLIILPTFLILSSCDEPTAPEYYPEKVTFYLYDWDGTLLQEYEVHGDPFFNGATVPPERENYKFHGYFFEPDDGNDYVVEDDYYALISSSGYTTRHFKYNSWIVRSEPVKSIDIKLYAHYSQINYSPQFTRGDADCICINGGTTTYDYADFRVFTDRILGYGNIEHPPLTAKKSGFEFVGWFNSDGEQIMSETGELLMPLEEFYGILRQFQADNLAANSWNQDHYKLFPHFTLESYNVTLDLSSLSVNSETVRVQRTTELSEFEFPIGFYGAGKYVVGWSADPEVNTPPTGELTGELTLYPITVDAISLNAVILGEGSTAYLLSDGRLVFEHPDGYDEKYGFCGAFSDSQMKNFVSLSSLNDGDTFYLKWDIAAKTVTVNPMNGGAAYSLTLHYDTTLDSFDPPTFDGYSIAGLYTDREYTGEPTEFSFDAVTDGATYYVKWQKN